MNLIKEFRPTLLFLAKFLAFYFLSNILYGLWIESYGNSPDPFTILVTQNISSILNWMDFDTFVGSSKTQPYVLLFHHSTVILSVFEGCNGLNVMFVFASFLFAFGPMRLFTFYYFIGGIVIIHVVNLLRIGLLYWLALNNSTQFYYFHKYFFTATLYMVVFLMWSLWIFKINDSKPRITA
jgi:exosortase family protein XrtF